MRMQMIFFWKKCRLSLLNSLVVSSFILYEKEIEELFLIISVKSF